MSNLVDFAKRELGETKDPESYDGMIHAAVLELIQVFSDQGHSGNSAAITSNLFDRLSRFEPIGPLTGEDNEWTEYIDGHFQNKRCSHVFKDSKGGQAYDSEGKVFRDPDGSCWTGKDSRVYITFPYTPTKEYVDRPANDT